MSDNEACLLRSPTRTPWNKGKLIGAKPPLRPKHVWSIRTRLMVEGRTLCRSGPEAVIIATQQSQRESLPIISSGCGPRGRGSRFPVRRKERSFIRELRAGRAKFLFLYQHRDVVSC
jgi:hypothetical protein